MDIFDLTQDNDEKLHVTTKHIKRKVKESDSDLEVKNLLQTNVAEVGILRLPWFLVEVEVPNLTSRILNICECTWMVKILLTGDH